MEKLKVTVFQVRLNLEKFMFCVVKKKRKNFKKMRKIKYSLNL